MGLDMFLTARKFLFDDRAKLKTQIKKALNCNLEPKEIIFVVIYWRKVNAIHQWFVEHVQEADDCELYCVSSDELKELLNTIIIVLEDKTLAKELLPIQTGLFFGSPEYDSYYWAELERTKAELENIFKTKLFDDFELYYQASW